MLNNNAFLQLYSYAINNPFYRHWPCRYMIVCVCVWERERDKEKEGVVCVCVCVWVREKVCVYVCAREYVRVTNVGENPNEGGRLSYVGIQWLSIVHWTVSSLNTPLRPNKQKGGILYSNVELNNPNEINLVVPRKENFSRNQEMVPTCVCLPFFLSEICVYALSEGGNG